MLAIFEIGNSVWRSNFNCGFGSWSLVDPKVNVSLAKHGFEVGLIINQFEIFG